MPQRVTFLLDDELATALRKKQSELIIKLKSSVAFSFVLNQTLRKSLKKWTYNRNSVPISYLINILVLPLIDGLISENIFLAGALLALPFILASWIRIYIIDLIYNKYQVGVLEIVKRTIKEYGRQAIVSLWFWTEYGSSESGTKEMNLYTCTCGCGCQNDTNDYVCDSCKAGICRSKIK